MGLVLKRGACLSFVVSRFRRTAARFVAALAVATACGDPPASGGPPDYELLLAPASLNVVQGANPTVTVTIERNNFTGGVVLFLTGAPAQVSGSFLPGTTNGTSSTLTVSVGASVTPGSYDLVVNGNGAPGARTTTLPLTVTAAPNYSLELTPGTLSIAQGSSDSTVISIARSNFGGAVTLGLNGVVTGIVGAFNPAAPTTSSSTLTITVGASVPTGQYPLTVTGNATIGDRTAPLTLTVTP